MFELMRRNNNHSVNSYNPFREMEEFEKNFFSPFGSFFGTQDLAEFKTDVTDEGDHYLLEADLPGFKKDEIQVHLENGYLTVSAEKHADKQAGKGKYLRQERYSGTVSRTFYVGDALKPDDVKAKYEDGVLVVSLSKKAPEAIEQRSQIAIEG